MKFISKDGSIHKNRLSMLVCDVRHTVSNRLHQRSDEDYIMDFEEFDDDDFDCASDDEDEPSPNIDTLVVHKTGDNQFMVINESHDQSFTPVASYTISSADTGNETHPKGDYSVPFTPGTSSDTAKERTDGAWGFIPDNRSDGVIEDEMYLIRGYINEDIPEYVDKLKRVAPTRRPYELTEEEKKAWVPTNSLLPPQQYFDTVIRRECDKMNVNTPSSRSVLYNLNIMVEINGVKMNAAKAMEYAELNDRLINDMLYEEAEDIPEQL